LEGINNGKIKKNWRALIFMPITFAVPVFIVGVIGAFLYNLVVGRVGGLELDFEQIDNSTANNHEETT